LFRYQDLEKSAESGKNFTGGLKMYVGVIQMAPEHSTIMTYDLMLKNIQKSMSLIDQIAEQGPTDIVVLPEFLFTGPVSTIADFDGLVKNEVQKDTGIIMLAEKAQQKKISVIAPLFVKQGDSCFNACVLINPEGKVEGQYFKVHLYPPEKVLLTSGNNFDVCPLMVNAKNETVGLQICFDLMFPEGCRILSSKGAKVIFYPTMCEDWLMDYFEPIAKARAIENGVFVVLVNSVGEHPRTGGKLSGRSLIAGPTGKVISLGTGEKWQRVFLDLDEVDQARSELNFISERRPQSYVEITRSFI
jgi:N-carbamoylputrescine amidase